MDTTKNTSGRFRAFVACGLICGLAFSGAFAWDTSNHDNFGAGLGIAITVVAIAAIVSAVTWQHPRQAFVRRRPYAYYDAPAYQAAPQQDIDVRRPVIHDTVYVR